MNAAQNIAQTLVSMLPRQCAFLILSVVVFGLEHSKPQQCSAQTPATPQWAALGRGMNNSVEGLTVFNGSLVACGRFTNAGGTPSNYIAQWNSANNQWEALGGGLNRTLEALAVYNSELIAGGFFSSASNRTDSLAASFAARWNGSRWNTLGSGMNAPIRALASWNNLLIAGGGFTVAGGNATPFIGQWNGSQWSSIGSGISAGVSDTVYALETYRGNLIAAGNFRSAGGTTANFIAQWNGTTWQVLGTGTGTANGVNDRIYGLAVYRDMLYATGDFTSAGGKPASYIARWDGVQWNAVGNDSVQGVSDKSRAMKVFNGVLYVGGNFLRAGSVVVNRIAAWDGKAWSAVGSGCNNWVECMEVWNNSLIVGGYFSQMNGVSAIGIARLTLQPSLPQVVQSGQSQSALADAALRVSPNPAAHSIRIEGLEGASELVIANVLGQTLLTKKVQQIPTAQGVTLDVSLLPVGMYTLIIRTKQYVSTRFVHILR
jgi:hypothetical protein